MTRTARKTFTYSQTSEPTHAEKSVQTPVPVEVLLDILRRPRFSGSVGEDYVIDKYLLTLPGVQEDGYGNIWLTVLDADDELPRTMFSSHTDTVHKAKATDTYKLSLNKCWLSVAGSGVLGADCGTGIWIMLNMIKAKVPGYYVFHRDEEIGGKGSSYIATHLSTLLEGRIDHCIAFDRKGVTDVITHQGFSRCCSDTFAQAFAQQLNMGTGMAFAPDDSGTFTDSANYTHLIPECTNLAIGYYDQHTQQECQDLSFVTALVMKLINIDYTQLPVERDPAVEEELDDSHWGNYFGKRYGSYDYLDDLDDLDNPLAKTPKGQSLPHSFEKMSNLVETYPGACADILEQMGFDLDGLATELENTYDYDLSQWRERY